MLRSAVEIELKLAVLIDWAKRSDWCRALALLAKALAPELHIPSSEAREAIAVRQHHRGPHAAFLGEADHDRSADRRSEVDSALGLEHRVNDALRAISECHHIEAAGEGWQETDVSEAREAAANAGIVGKRRD